MIPTMQPEWIFRLPPLHRAIYINGNDVDVTLFSEAIDLEEEDEFGTRPIDYAVMRHAHDVLDKLIAAGVDVNCRTQSGYTPLWGAVLNNNAEAVQKLLRAGADFRISPSLNYTIFNSCVTKDLVIWQTLLAYGARPNEQEAAGFDKLMPRWRGDIPRVRFLDVEEEITV